MSDGKWTRFWFEGNRYFHWVEGPEDWEKVKEAHRDPGIRPVWTVDEILDKAKVCAAAEYPKYGFAVECDGDETLRQFFAENGMAA